MTNVLIAYGPAADRLNQYDAVAVDGLLRVVADDATAVGVDDRHVVVCAAPTRAAATAAEVLNAADRWLSADELSCRHGMVALVDRADGRIVVRRDPVGVGCVHYRMVADTLLVGTDLDVVVAAAAVLGAAPHIDEEAVAAYLAFQYVPAPRTIWAGIAQLPPGAQLALSTGATTPTVQYLHPPVTGAADGDPAVAVALVEESLRRQLDPGQPVATLLSGGVDTSVNAILLTEELGVRATAYTAAFVEPGYDETPYAAAVCAALRLPHEVLTITSADVAALEELTRRLSTPHGDRALFAQHVVFRAVREAGFGQIVTGEGGDELLGYPRMRDGHETLPDLPGDPEELAAWYLRRTCLADDANRRGLLAPLGVDPELGARVLSEHYGRWSAEEPFSRLLYGQWRTWLPDGVLRKDTEAARWHDLVPVLPFASAELAGYVAGLSHQAQRTWLRDKALMRPRLAKSLPEQVLTKPKHKFWLPFSEWFRDAWRDLLYETLTDPDAPVLSSLDGAGIRRLLAEHQTGEDHSRLLWGLLVLARWADAHRQPWDGAGWWPRSAGVPKAAPVGGELPRSPR